MGKREHLAKRPKQIRIGVMTISSSRDEKTDKSGKWIRKQAEREKFGIVFYKIVADVREMIAQTLMQAISDHSPHAMILTGGTGISPSDVTIEAVRPILEKEMTAFSALFAQLSFEEIGSAALLSRSMAGIIGQSAVFCIPGSLPACKLACNELIFPEITHIAAHIAPATE